ncbi:hypothetical protein RJ640_024074 [Escallonia rubra]|uniref:Glycosyltransferase n=1 Tax=Escallonia rubra TaxID=112253 RepID=A0AA88SK73_9ASTE|nr:hypothetical protein RJ640_024074 [Escallonia rubra]
MLIESTKSALFGMAPPPHQLHFVMIPLMSPGHLIPMVDMAKLLAQRAVTVTIVTTPRNTARFGSTVGRAVESGLAIRLLQLPFPSVEAGLPEGCENIDDVPSHELYRNFIAALNMLQKPLEQVFGELEPSPSCIISDKTLAWTAETAKKFHIPWIIFDGMSCFNAVCTHNLHVSKIHESVSDSKPFVVPGLPDRIELTKLQLPGAFNPSVISFTDVRERIRVAAEGAYGVVVNSFEELEPRYLDEYQKIKGINIWCIGPLSLCNTDNLDRSQRGNKAAIDEHQCLRWLDSWHSSSVVYACLGSLTRLTPPQFVELALGLEASNHPFILVIKSGGKLEEIEKWITEEGFEERVKGRGLLIRGWAPQVLILSHPATGGFLTHCGWNSTLEGVCAGVPMITWPMFAEQFINDKFVVQVLGTGVGVGAQVVVHLGEEDRFGVKVRRDEVKKAIDKVMDAGAEGEERRQRAREIRDMAKTSTQKGGSSHLNITLLIQSIARQANDVQSS